MANKKKKRKKNTFFREMERNHVICHHSREINTRDFLPSPSSLFFHPREMACYLDCRIGSTNLLPINRVSEWSGSPSNRGRHAIFLRYSKSIFIRCAIVHALRHTPSIPFQFVQPTIQPACKLLLFETDWRVTDSDRLIGVCACF